MMAISFHEFAHAWVADKLGDHTARFAGRMTLDPRSHFDVFGFCFLYLLVLDGLRVFHIIQIILTAIKDLERF